MNKYQLSRYMSGRLSDRRSSSYSPGITIVFFLSAFVRLISTNCIPLSSVDIQRSSLPSGSMTVEPPVNFISFSVPVLLTQA